MMSMMSIPSNAVNGCQWMSMVPRLVIHLLQRLDILSLQGREEVGDLRRLRAGTQWIQSAEISSVFARQMTQTPGKNALKKHTKSGH